MKFSILAVIVFISQISFGADQTVKTSFEQNLKPFMELLKSTNNVEIALRKMKPQLTPELYTQFQKILKKAPSKFTNIQVTSPVSFKVKVGNKAWINYAFSYENGNMVIEGQEYKWNYKKSAQYNMNEMYKIVDTAVMRKSKTVLIELLLPEARADFFQWAHDQIFGAVGAAVGPGLNVDAWLSNVEKKCYGEPTLYKFKDRDTERANFFEALEYTRDGSLFTEGYYFKFYKVQHCLRQKQYITQSETWIRDDHREKHRAEVFQLSTQ